MSFGILVVTFDSATNSRSFSRQVEWALKLANSKKELKISSSCLNIIGDLLGNT